MSKISGNLSEMKVENSILTIQKIYFDGTFLESKSGVGRDSRNLLIAAKLAYGESVQVIYPHLRLFSRIVRICTEPTKSKFQKILKVRSIVSRKPEICPIEEQSLFIQSHLHCVTPTPDLKLKYIVRLHDVFPISNPEWFRWYSRRTFSVGFHNAINRAIFICDSRTTQNELNRIINQEIVTSTIALCPVVVPSGLLCNNCSGCSTLVLRQRHVISISTLEPRKNYLELISAWVNSDAFRLCNTHLYIVGRQGWKSSKLARQLTKYGSDWGICWIKDACDESVQELLRSSEFLVSTSFEEGFNLSVAEALIQEVPVLISNNQVHTEIYFSVANFYNLGNRTDLSNKIKKLLSERRTLNAGFERELFFGKYDTALKTLASALRDS